MMVADFVFDDLASRGVRDVFTVAGGGIMFLLDALGRHPNVTYWACGHEQACAIAAESYARVTGGIGVCLVTSGPGATNALSAIPGAYVDSVPVLVISGQVRTNLIADYTKHRQIGPQEINIIEMAEPVTKYAKTVYDPAEVPGEIEKAIAIATSGRPGPVWLNIPLDVQSAQLPAGTTAPEAAVSGLEPGSNDPASIDEVATLLREAKRPVIVTGNGIHIAHAEDAFVRFVRHVGCPVVATMGGMDLLAEDDAQYLGRFGPTGQRRANFTLQSADLLLCLGASMAVKDVGFDTSGFAPRARRVMVNIEAEEMRKPHFVADTAVLADVKWFMERFVAEVPTGSFAFDERWLPAVAKWKRDYPIVTDDYYEDPEHVNTYVLAAEIAKVAEEGEVVLTGNASDAVSMHHSFAVKPHQRVITNYGFGAMGWDLPAAVGAAVAQQGGRVLLVTGDGSIQLNIQELLTIGHNCLNVKVFVLNNGGYETIRATQTNFFEGRFYGCHAESGLANPRFDALAEAYGLRYKLLSNNADVEAGVAEVMAEEGPWLVEANISFLQEKKPKTVSRRLEDGTMVSPSLDDQYPFLPREEHAVVMGLFADEDSAK
ncbi:MAG: thiamine pyrophosphate-binding protein [Actinobacteria bacterium]|nr:thiamine pyrophosphate-binding protein [Actinomycetota bacterium]